MNAAFKTTGLKFRLILSILFLFPATSQAIDINWLHFRGAGVLMLQNGGNLVTGSLSWNPLISIQSLDTSIRDLFGIRLHAGAMGIKNPSNEYSFALDYQALWATRFETMSFEIGPGVQNFVAQGGSRMTVNSNLDMDFGFSRGIMRALRQLVIGYSAVIDNTYFTHQVRLGIGIQL
ncbi:MAG: hypothetical protein KA715_13735 [Xanthomonadaceae bacterium]|nr:hypothetical protein [Xanthomonadaceae bacterium]